MSSLEHKIYTFKTFESPDGKSRPIDAKVVYGLSDPPKRAIGKLLVVLDSMYNTEVMSI